MDALKQAIESFVLKKYPWIVDVHFEKRGQPHFEVWITIIYDVEEKKSYKEMSEVHRVTDQIFRMIGLPDWERLDGVKFREKK